jgi:hypothetical protein
MSRKEAPPPCLSHIFGIGMRQVYTKEVETTVFLYIDKKQDTNPPHPKKSQLSDATVGIRITDQSFLCYGDAGFGIKHMAIRCYEDQTVPMWMCTVTNGNQRSIYCVSLLSWLLFLMSWLLSLLSWLLSDGYYLYCHGYYLYCRSYRDQYWSISTIGSLQISEPIKLHNDMIIGSEQSIFNVL